MREKVAIFLSYTAADRQLCTRLWADLKSAASTDKLYEFEFWSMDVNLLAGDDFEERIKQALASSDAGVFAVSHAMLTSEFIQGIELDHFLAQGKVIVPVLVSQLNKFADLKGLEPRQIYGWQQPYEGLPAGGRRRDWATGLAEQLHQVLAQGSAP